MSADRHVNASVTSLIWKLLGTSKFFFRAHTHNHVKYGPGSHIKAIYQFVFCPLLIGLMLDMAGSQVMTLRWFKCDIGFLGRPDLCPSLLSTLSLTPQTQFSPESSALVHVIKRFACLSPSTKSAPLRTIKKTAYHRLRKEWSSNLLYNVCLLKSQSLYLTCSEKWPKHQLNGHRSKQRSANSKDFLHCH